MMFVARYVCLDYPYELLTRITRIVLVASTYCTLGSGNLCKNGCPRFGSKPLADDPYKWAMTSLLIWLFVMVASQVIIYL
jgi:hypothetical protein